MPSRRGSGEARDRCSSCGLVGVPTLGWIAQGWTEKGAEIEFLWCPECVAADRAEGGPIAELQDVFHGVEREGGRQVH